MRIAAAVAALALSAPAAAFEFVLPTSTTFPYAKVTNAARRDICQTWADPRVCNLVPGRTYTLHRFTPDWRDYRTRITARDDACSP